ncbi:Uma2 family endonuclease [Nitratiruptor tergarcus]|uniref:Uncharacterized protein conserved in cyanobacteria n=1 Tax=Nitratiruptor tergarcus DSM 16512 TaxID=1069081 RepID=A0A1W1WR36_9BACT|nr:Uma2 family endonuclease [Nitratiruptor tergarcus]SMC08675.1 Uncharacterized protein conserved in cyanobacteria [Nitratiruptor tergarcus DSM 16512]
MTARYIPEYTYEDYKQWEGDWELIDGVPIAMAPSPVSEHQMLLSRIAYELEKSLEECDECFVLVEEDWKIDEKNVVRPDISVVCGELTDFIQKAPFIIVEIVSPSSATRDEDIKFAMYAEEGVEYYILVYPKDYKAKVYKLKDGKYRKIGDFLSEKVKLEGKCDVAIDFANVFRKLKKLKNAVH